MIRHFMVSIFWEKDGEIILKSNTSTIFTRKYFVFILALICVFLVKSSAYPVASSVILEVPYHDQQTSFYCGPAAIQMVLEYSNGMYLSQDKLGSEVNVDAIEGVTYTYAMDEPFQARNISKVSSGRTSLTQLKQKINQGYAPILLIWFDQNHESGHYVVAVGYNETGVFINDPWPEGWMLPEGRETGSYVYLSNEELKDLWSNYYQWSMTVPFTQPDDKSFKVEVELNGLPEDATTTLYLNGKAIETLTGEETTTLLLIDEPDYHFLRVDLMIEDDNGIDYICSENRVLVGKSHVIEFNYQQFRQFDP
jgi:hypothetical protein